jgi:creatinine amidohydrolase
MPEEERARALAEHRFERLTWTEINEAVDLRKVVVLPVGSTEQHGYHLPLDVDTRLASSVALEAGRRAPEGLLVLPSIAYGYTHHVMDFPGTINIEPSTFVRFVLDVARSVAYHGFDRIIILNGHGSKHPLIEQAPYWNAEVRTSVNPGGCAHAGELETSMYLHVDGDAVLVDRTEGALPDYMSLPGGDRWQYVDLTGGSGPATIVERTSSYTESGAFGAPQEATAEKGEQVFEHAVGQLVEMARWFRDRPALPAKDRRVRRPEREPRFGF